MLAGLGVLVLFPLPFYVGLAVFGWTAPWQVALIALVALALALVAVWVVIAVQRKLAEPADAGQYRQAMAEERARVQALIAAQPELARWQPLVARWGTMDEATLLRYEGRYRELSADPRRGRYAQQLLHGDWRTDEEIEYLESPDRVVTCAHLAPIERDLRRFGIRAAPAGAARRLWTEASLALEPLAAARYDTAGLSEEIHYDHPRGDGVMLIHCRGCDALIASRGGVRFPPRSV